MEAKIYIMKCVTNLHAGSGESNYSVVDNQVQRDPVTEYPSVFSSGIKGALREHFRNKGIDLNTIFGSDRTAVTGEKIINSKPGTFKFTSAQLLAIPMRVSEGSVPYGMVTSKTALMSFIDFLTVVGKGDNCDLKKNIEEFADEHNYKITSPDRVKSIEGIEIGNEQLEQLPKLQNFMKSLHLSDNNNIPIVVLSEKEFNARMKYLPVAARNRLEPPKNLWYEEFVPHESVFWFSIMCDKSHKNLLDEFSGVLTKDIVQIGADATIGDGLTVVYEYGSQQGGEDEA